MSVFTLGQNRAIASPVQRHCAEMFEGRILNAYVSDFVIQRATPWNGPRLDDPNLD